jgi:hypothetical protein
MTTTNTSAPFDSPNADIIIRTSDNVQLRTYKILLSSASPIFKDMLAMPQPPEQADDEQADDLPVVDVTETNAAIRNALHFCYPTTIRRIIKDRDGLSLSEIVDVLEAITKYEMHAARKAALQLLVDPCFLEAEPLRVFAIACRFRAEAEARLAARHLLCRPLLQDEYPAELDLIDCRSLYRVMVYHKKCTEAAANAASDHKWITAEYAFFGCQAAGCKTIAKRAQPAWRGEPVLYHVQVHRWWLNFMESTRTTLSSAVRVEAIGDKQRVADTLLEASTCDTCRLSSVGDLLKFIDVFKAEVEDRISKVHTPCSSDLGAD